MIENKIIDIYKTNYNVRKYVKYLLVSLNLPTGVVKYEFAKKYLQPNLNVRLFDYDTFFDKNFINTKSLYKRK